MKTPSSLKEINKMIFVVNKCRSFNLFLSTLLLHHLVKTLHAHASGYVAALLHLLHHVLYSPHASNGSQHVGIHSLSHTLVNLKKIQD